MPYASKQALQDFLSVVEKQSEPGIVIAVDNAEQDHFMHELLANGFTQSKTVFDLLKSPKTFLLVDAHNGKLVYDFCVQYPTKQIELQNSATMETHVLLPEQDSSHTIIFILTKETLHYLQSTGLTLLRAVGPAFQS